MEESVSPNLAKELLNVIFFLEDDFIDRLPDDFINKLVLLAADSDKNFVLKKDKKLWEQEISEECKNYLALLYYQFSSRDKQNELIESWAKNDLDN